MSRIYINRAEKIDTFRRFLIFHLNPTQSFSSCLTVNAVSIRIAKRIVSRREIIAVCSMKGRKIIKLKVHGTVHR